MHAAGHRVGRYTSPHLERLEERFVIGEREVETERASRCRGRRAAERSSRWSTGGTLSGPPTFFECATAIAFELFRRRGVDIAVLEVGLGGRLDATNVVSPIAAAITSIDFDHQAQLGDTLTSIAREKAGIIKPGIPVVCGPLPHRGRPGHRRDLPGAGRPADPRARPGRRRVARTDDGDTVVNLQLAVARSDDIRLALRGRHQIANAAVAMSLLEELGALGFDGA